MEFHWLPLRELLAELFSAVYIVFKYIYYSDRKLSSPYFGSIIIPLRSTQVLVGLVVSSDASQV